MFYTKQSFQEKFLKGIKSTKAKYGVDFVCKWIDDIHFCYIVNTFIGANVLLKSFNVRHCVCHSENYWEQYNREFNKHFIKVFVFNISDECHLDDTKFINKNFCSVCEFEGTGWLCKNDSIIDDVEHFELLRNYHTCSNQTLSEWSYQFMSKHGNCIPNIFDNKYDVEILRYIITNRNEIRRLYQIFK